MGAFYYLFINSQGGIYMSLEDQDLQEIRENLELYESLFDFWKTRKDVKPTQKVIRNPKDTHADPRVATRDDLTNQNKEADLDHFKNNEDIIKFINFIANLHNIDKIKDKKQVLIIFRKYRELLDVLVVALPFIKNKCRDFGIVIPKLVESKDMRSKIKRVFTK